MDFRNRRDKKLAVRFRTASEERLVIIFPIQRAILVEVAGCPFVDVVVVPCFQFCFKLSYGPGVSYPDCDVLHVKLLGNLLIPKLEVPSHVEQKLIPVTEGVEGLLPAFSLQEELSAVLKGEVFFAPRQAADGELVALGTGEAIKATPYRLIGIPIAVAFVKPHLLIFFVQPVTSEVVGNPLEPSGKGTFRRVVGAGPVTCPHVSLQLDVVALCGRKGEAVLTVEAVDGLPDLPKSLTGQMLHLVHCHVDVLVVVFHSFVVLALVGWHRAFPFH